MKVRRKRKTGRKILALVLTVCMLFTASPNLWDAVMVQAAETIQNDTDAVIQALHDRIAALPDAEEYLASEPDMEDEDAYAEWEEKLYEYVEEALAIWEEYGALTEEQQTQMREGELEKLDAWMEIAETLKESSQVMAADNGSHKHCVCGGNINIGDHTSHTEDIVYDNILTSDNGQLLVNGAVQSDYTLTTGKYYLADNVELGSELIIAENSTVYICLNNHTLSYDRSNGKHRVMTVGEKATLNLCTCGNSGVITGGDADSSSYGGGLYLSGNSIFNMYGGSIEGNVTSGSGGGIFSGQYAACNLYEVNICRNTGLNGAGIIVSHILNIYGGEIKNNDATGYGGGIAGTAESCILQDVKICNNTAAYAAGLYWANGNLIMSDVEISNNIVSNSTARYPAGGVALMQGTIGISGTIIITGNQYNGKQNNFWNYCNPSAARPSKLVIVDDLDEQSVIGLTNKTTPNEAAPDPVEVASGSNHTITDADWSRFFSDEEGYKIVKDQNALFLALPDTCDLSGLDLTAEGAKLEPNFQADITTYTATVGNDVEKVGITATLAGTTDGKTIKIKNGTDLPETDMTSGKKKEVPLAVGLNTIEITVTSGSETKTYTIEITREAPAGNPVTITFYKDGVKWTGADAPSDSDYKLTSDGGSTFLPSLVAPDGTYKIYSGDTDTGVEVTVAGAETSVRVDYYTVTFYDGSTALTIPAQQTVLKNQTASAPATNLTKTGYTFGKWVTADGGSTAYDFTKAVTGKTLVYASWTPVSYKIEYDLDGGTATGNPTSYTIESSAITLKNPTRTGYTFTGWSGTDLTGNNNISVTIAAGSIGNREYTAHWNPAKYTVTLHTNGGSGGTNLTSYTFGMGATLPDNWTKKGYIFDGWYDNESCTGTAVTNILGTDTGNKEYWAKWTDNIAPVIGTLTYNYQPKNFWQWLIGKDSLLITVPVTEEGSGADKITYTMTPEGGTAKVETATIKNGDAELTVSADFKGTISIICTDKAGNTSAGVTVGAGLGATGIIIEDNAPKIEFKAGNAELLDTGEYKAAPDIAVTVTDNKDNAISGGIASVSYKIGNGSEKTVSHDYLSGMVVNDSFTIPASEISAGETVISVTATDHAGNSVTTTKTIKVHTHSGTLVPAVKPTCTTVGNKEHYNCACGKWFSDSGCTNEITDKSSVVVNALEHDFSGEYLFDTEEHWKKCSRCPATDSREEHSFEEGGTHCTKCEFEKAGEGHTHRGTLQNAADPTCTAEGNTAYYTCTCGKWFSDSSCTMEIADESSVIIPALKHDFSGEYQFDISEHWKVCSRCNATQPKENHVFDDDNDATCNKCGYVRTVAEHTHSVAETVSEIAATCTENGNKAYYICSCDKWFSDSACTDEITDHAGVVIEKLGHDFGEGYQFDKNGHWKVCSRCGETGLEEAHVYDSDTDTDCNQCGYRRAIENPGNVSKDVEKDEKAPDTVLSASAEELADILLTEEEKRQIENGTDIRFILDVKDAEDTVNSSDKAAVQEVLNGFVVGQYLDISLFKVIGAERSAISQTSKKLTIVIDVPDSLRSRGGDSPRTFAVICVHNGKAKWLEDLDDNTDTITITTDRFSVYAIVYQEAGSGEDIKPSPTPDEKEEKASDKEKRKIEIHSGLKAIQTGKKLQISWGRVSGADGYSVYVQYCGKDFGAKSLNQVKSGKKTKITVKKVNGKKLDTTKNFKLYVVAWQIKNGKKSVLTQTLIIHVAGKDSVKYTNVKKIQVKKTSYTLKKGGAVTLRPKAVLQNKRKKQLSAAHTKEFRYISSNKKIATVTESGKVKAKGTGECNIYVFAKNGCRRKIKIKVEK